MMKPMVSDPDADQIQPSIIEDLIAMLVTRGVHENFFKCPCPDPSRSGANAQNQDPWALYKDPRPMGT